MLVLARKEFHGMGSHCEVRVPAIGWSSSFWEEPARILRAKAGSMRGRPVWLALLVLFLLLLLSLLVLLFLLLLIIAPVFIVYALMHALSAGWPVCLDNYPVWGFSELLTGPQADFTLPTAFLHTRSPSQRATLLRSQSLHIIK